MIAKAVLEEVIGDYDFNQEVITPVEELIANCQQSALWI